MLMSWVTDQLNEAFGSRLYQYRHCVLVPVVDATSPPCTTTRSCRRSLTLQCPNGQDCLKQQSEEMLSVSGVEVTEIVDTLLRTWECSEAKHGVDKVTHSWPVFCWTARCRLAQLQRYPILCSGNHVNADEQGSKDRKHSDSFWVVNTTLIFFFSSKLNIQGKKNLEYFQHSLHSHFRGIKYRS